MKLKKAHEMRCEGVRCPLKVFEKIHYSVSSGLFLIKRFILLNAPPLLVSATFICSSHLFCQFPFHLLSWGRGRAGVH